MHAPFLLPALLGQLSALRSFLALADWLQPACFDTERCKEGIGRLGAAVVESQVVFGRTAFVAVTFDHNDSVGGI